MSQETMIEPGWLTLKGAHAYCGLSVSSLEKAVQANEFKHRFRLVRLINRASLDEWFEGGDGQREATVKRNKRARVSQKGARP